MIKKYVDTDMLNTSLASKKDSSIIKINPDSPVTLEDNTEYYFRNISSLIFSYPSDNFEIWMEISTSENEDLSIIFPEDTMYIGAPPIFLNN